MFRRLICVALVAAAVWTCPATAGSKAQSVCEAVPADAVAAFWLAGPIEGEETSSAVGTLGLAGFLLDQARNAGLFAKVDGETRIWLDVLASLPVLVRYPHVLTLLDINAKPCSDGGHRLAELHAALIIRAGEDHALVEQRIQHLIRTYTNSENSAIESSQDSGELIYTLKDRRMPAWAVVSWCKVGEFYIVAIGEGTIGRVLAAARDRTSSLAGESWFEAAMSHTSGSDARVACYVDFKTLRSSVDRSLARKIENVKVNLHLVGVEKGLWVVRRNGKAIEAGALVRRGGRDVDLRIAGAKFLDALPAAVIPDDVSYYAAIQCRPKRVVLGLADAYLAARSQAVADDIRLLWQRVLRAAGIDIADDILAHLGRLVVIHDSPRAAIGLPLACTILIRVEGDADLLRKNIDTLLGYVRDNITNESVVKVMKAPDGVWFLRIGVNGPSLAIANGWLVFSFSPEAVRQNIRFISSNKQ